jgi:hypothetical protein
MTRVAMGGDREAEEEKLTISQRQAAERAKHLERVCASFPATITADGARRLARLLTPIVSAGDE